MKKYNEGYALPFVRVVLVVMCIIAVGIMDFSLRNLESQQSTIQRMEAKYEAAGKIEEIVAAIQNGKSHVFDISGHLNFAEDETQDTLRVIASCESSEDQNLWVIVELELSATDWPVAVTQTALKVEKKSLVTYLRYEIVDSDTAAAFLNGDYPGNGGNGQ